MTNLKVRNRKNNQVGTATQLTDGRVEVVFEGTGEVKIVAPSTFKRWYKQLGENKIAVPAVQNLKENADADKPAVEDKPADAEKPADTTETPEAVVAPPEADKPADKPAVDPLEGMKIELVDAVMQPTATSHKFFTVIRLNEYMLEITEYSGYITQVVSLDQKLKDEELRKYKSPKASIADVLNYLGIAEDKFKAVKSRIVALRKEGKVLAEEEMLVEAKAVKDAEASKESAK